MLCCVVQLVMFVGGIVALVKGKLSLSSDFVFEGTAARVAAVFLLLPLPLEFMLGVVLAVVQQLRGARTDALQGNPVFILAEIGIVVGCLVGAVVTGKLVTRWAPRAVSEWAAEDVDYWRDHDEAWKGEVPPQPAPGDYDPPGPVDDRFRE
jgi:hypothetical protein